MNTNRWLALALALLGAVGPSIALAQAAPSRGQLLYDTHCIACHDARLHWRDNKLASDWVTLRALVRQWQGSVQLQWSDGDIDEVARHLNDKVYHFAPPSPRG